MTAHASIAREATDPDGAAAWERALLDRQLESLDRLAQMAMALAETVQARACAPEASDAVVQHAAMDFARVSRAVRMTLALQSRLVRDFKTPIKAASTGSDDPDDDEDDDDDSAPFAITWAYGRPVTSAAERRALRQSVRHAAEDRGLDAETVERMESEALERLEREDLFPPHPPRGYRVFDQIVAIICKDLGLAPEAADSPAPPQCDEERGTDREGAVPSPPSGRVAERPLAWSG